MSDHTFFKSLRSKLFLIMLIALLIAAFVFVSVREVGNFLVWRYYLAETTKQERAEKYIEEFQDYVVYHKLSIHDSEKISEWSPGLYVDIILYKDSNLVYAPEWFVDAESDEESTDAYELESATRVEAGLDDERVEQNKSELLDFAEDGWFSGDRGFEQYFTEEARESYQKTLDSLLSENRELRPVYFLDGTLLICVVDYTENFIYNLVTATSIIAAFFVLAVIMIINFSETARRVNRLANTVRRVEEGNLEMPIVLEGNDELSALAKDVNSMRNAVVDTMSKERQAWEANAELITAMSHDIRTPLTVLLGYLDLMEIQKKDGVNVEYVEACKENAMRLKRLSDDMFSYFLVFGKNDLSLDLSQEIDCATLEHMLAEREVLLSELGFEVIRSRVVPRAKVKIDIAYFSRVMDNIFSNLSKYADPGEPIYVGTDFDGSTLTVSVKNHIKAEEDRAESNGIGIKTCVKIMELLNGSFAILNEEEYYTVLLKLPASPAEEENVDFANS